MRNLIYIYISKLFDIFTSTRGTTPTDGQTDRRNPERSYNLKQVLVSLGRIRFWLVSPRK